MASIISMTFVDGANKGLELGNEEFGRDLSIGSAWTRIRVGVMLNIVPDGTNNITVTQVRLGFSNGAANHAGSPSGQLWYGTLFGGSSTSLTGGTLVYNAGAGNPYFSSSGVNRYSNVNGTPSGAGNAGSFGQIPTTSGGASNRRAVMCCEIKKTGTSMQVGGGCSADGTTDLTESQFRAWMAQPTDIAAGGTPLNCGSTACGAFSTTTFANYTTNAATYGEVIAPHFGWPIALTTLIRIYAIEVYRLE